jgi:hypothetical protein
MNRLLVLVVALAIPLCAQFNLKRGSKVFIEKMENDLDGYITAELVQKKVALEIVSDLDQADYVMVGNGTPEQGRKWHQGWLTAEQDRTSGNIRVFDKATKKLVFAGEAGDRSLWWGHCPEAGSGKLLLGSLAN